MGKTGVFRTATWGGLLAKFFISRNGLSFFKHESMNADGGVSNKTIEESRPEMSNDAHSTRVSGQPDASGCGSCPQARVFWAFQTGQRWNPRQSGVCGQEPWKPLFHAGSRPAWLEMPVLRGLEGDDGAVRRARRALKEMR